MFAEHHPTFRARGRDKEASKVWIDFPFMPFPGMDGATHPFLIRMLLLSMSGWGSPTSLVISDYVSLATHP